MNSALTTFLFFTLLSLVAFSQNATIDATAGNASTAGSVTVIQDSDRDGLLDSEEDTNNNGVIDAGETDPNNPDTDGDGLTDKQEVDAGSDPLVNQFEIEPDWKGVPADIQNRMKGFWDFEAYEAGYVPRITYQKAIAKPNQTTVANNFGNLQSCVKLGGSGYIDIHPKALWEHNRNWNLSFSAKFDANPVFGGFNPYYPSANSISVFSMFATNYSLADPNSDPMMELVLRNGYSIVNPYVNGMILTLLTRDLYQDVIYGEWKVPSGVDLTQWNNYSFNANGAYHTNDRWCYINGAKVDLIPPVTIGYYPLSDVPQNKSNTGYLIFGATKINGSAVVSPISLALDRLGIAQNLTAAQNATLTARRDTDLDGMLDLDEIINGTEPLVYNPDVDSDGLTNTEETLGSASFDGGTTTVNFGATNPGYFDSDNDLFDDYWEAKYFSANVDPNDANKPQKDDPNTVGVIEGDYDNDGLSNYFEMLHGTNPNNADTDGDGITDDVEAEFGSNPLLTAEKPLKASDFYGDENLGSFAPIGDLRVILKANGGNDPKVTAQVGDESVSHSERWRLLIGDKRLVSPDFGVLSDPTEFALSTDEYHEILLRHVGTDPEKDTDLDYTALVQTSGSFLLCDPDELLGENFNDVDLNETQAKKAYLIPLDGFSWSESYSGGDAVGPRHRKVALNGRPMPDEKPQQEEESDLPDEETYVDAFNLSLHHDNTFTYLPLAASDLVLQASVSSSETGFTDRSGLLPHERLDLPFGAGWSSSLCSYVEVVENIGGVATDPVTVNVIDEAGRPQRFGTVNGKDFFPWPSTRVDKKTYLNSLSRNGEYFVLNKKFGNTLVYKQCKAWFLYSSDRQEGSTTMRRHTYWRLVEARDRYGVRLHYSYDEPNSPNEVSLIPRTISSPDRPNQFLVINRTADSRRVASITDSRGNTTTFQYASSNFSFSPTSNVGLSRLESVTYADGTSTSYTYTGGIEEETDISDPQKPRTTNHYHFNLSSITDKRGNTHSFSYAFDQSKKYWDSSVNGERVLIDIDHLPQEVQDCVETEMQSRYDQGHGEWKTMYGMPMMVTGVTLPGGIGSSTFSRVGEMKFSNTVQIPVAPETTVIDANGNVTVYEFSDVASELVDIDGTDKSISAEWMVYYLTSKIHHGGKQGQAGHLGTEIFEFDVASGLSLWRSTDFSGNVTTWEFGDSLTQPLTGLPANSQLMTKWADPTAKIDPLGRREEYSYGAYRVMSQVNNPLGTVTQFNVDGLGRRTGEVSLEDGITKLSQTHEAYQNQRFKAFRTQSSTQAFDNFTGQSWENDLVTRYLPDDRGRLWRTIVDPNGLKLTTENTYDFHNNLTSTIDGRGFRTIFEYDKLNRLVKTTFPKAGTSTGEAITTSEIWYDLNGNKAATIDEEGNYTMYHYDALNRRVKTIRDMDGLGLPTLNAEGLVEEANKGTATAADLVTEVLFDGVNAPTHSIDPNGNVTRTFYDAILRPTHVFTGLTLAEASSLSSATTAAATSTSKTHTEFLYTDSNLPMPGGVVKGNPGSSAFDSSGFKPTVMIRHDAILSTSGTTTLTTYASYDALYRPLQTKTEYEAGTFADSSVVYGAVTNGKEARVQQSTDDRGKVVRTLMDGLGRTTSVTDAYGDALAATTSTEYSSTGLAWKTIDPLGRESESDFDSAGRLIATWSPDPATGLVNRTTPQNSSSGSPVVRTAYDANSNVTVTVNPLGARNEFTYDARNRKVEELLPEVVSTEIINGQAVESILTQPLIETVFDGVGNVLSITDARGNTVRNVYDQAYRTTHVLSNPVTGNPSTDPSNLGANDIVVQSVFDKNSNVIEAIDGNGNATKNQYDSLNRLVATSTNPNDGQPNAPPALPKASDIVVKNTFDDAGNLVQVVDGEGHITGFRYDGLSRKTRTLWDEGSAVERSEQLSYDGLLLTSRVDPMNRTTNYQYDARHRLGDVLYTGSSSDNRHFTYDLVGNQLSVTYPNETTTRNALRATAQTFDQLNRVVTETSAGVTHSYDYDRANNRLATTYGGTGRTLSCSYDRQNRLTSCVESGTQETRYFYDFNGNITRKVLPSGAQKQAIFDALNRKLRESDYTSNGTLVSAFDSSQPQGAYPSGFDNVGNLVQSHEAYGHSSVKSRTLTNSYDHTYRLVTENITEAGGDSTLTSYAYDKTNNRTQKSVAVNGGSALVENSSYGTITDGFNSNQLKSVVVGSTTTSFSYDLNGNRSTKTVNGSLTQGYTWDHDNRLVTLAESGGTYQYAYDHRTRRVLRDESMASGVADVIVFSGGTSVQEYLLPTGSYQLTTPKVEYIRGSDYGGGVGGVLYTLRNGNRSFNTYNNRGDVISQTNTSGAITWQASYEAFGTRTQEQGTNSDRQRGNTKDEDPTGLLNEGMRYRDLEFGVFLSRDPAGFVDGPNVYTYVTQNPWTYFDPLGLSRSEIESHVRDLKKRRDYAANHGNPLTKQEADYFDRKIDKAVKDWYSHRVGELAFNPRFGRGSASEQASAEAIVMKYKILNGKDVEVGKTQSLTGGMQSGGGAVAANAPAMSKLTGNKPVKTQKDVNAEKPTEAYNRRKHYGNTPTKADRKAIGVGDNEVADHDPPLVKRYYEGDPSTGEKPGFLMTDEQRKASAKDRNRMKPQPIAESHQQGGHMSKYSKDKKKEHGL